MVDVRHDGDVAQPSARIRQAAVRGRRCSVEGGASCAHT
ncbi:hypothetical protein TOK_2111 [Pseudonocardia sp. N23]|nr:hypothetical protein TOK_2111 [Pseudonocardia sp. N23]